MDSDLLTSYDAAVDFLVKRANAFTYSPCSYHGPQPFTFLIAGRQAQPAAEAVNERWDSPRHVPMEAIGLEIGPDDLHAARNYDTEPAKRGCGLAIMPDTCRTMDDCLAAILWMTRRLGYLHGHTMILGAEASPPFVEWVRILHRDNDGLIMEKQHRIDFWTMVVKPVKPGRWDHWLTDPWHQQASLEGLPGGGMVACFGGMCF